MPQAQAQVSVLAHALHYGTSVFEGLRAYATPRGPAIFRLPEHTRRLFDSACIMRMPVPYSEQQLDAAIVETVRVNQWDLCYVRPLIWRGGQTLGVNPMPCPVQVMIATWQWGAYLGEDALPGARLITSAWVRLPANAMPGKAKAGATTSTPPWPDGRRQRRLRRGPLARPERLRRRRLRGEHLLPPRGRLYVISSSVNLEGITRASVLEIAREMGLEIQEVMATRDQLYAADEVFMTGTASR